MTRSFRLEPIRAIASRGQRDAARSFARALVTEAAVRAALDEAETALASARQRVSDVMVLSATGLESCGAAHAFVQRLSRQSPAIIQARDIAHMRLRLVREAVAAARSNARHATIERDRIERVKEGFEQDRRRDLARVEERKQSADALEHWMVRRHENESQSGE